MGNSAALPGRELQHGGKGLGPWEGPLLTLIQRVGPLSVFVSAFALTISLILISALSLCQGLQVWGPMMKNGT